MDKSSIWAMASGLVCFIVTVVNHHKTISGRKGFFTLLLIGHNLSLRESRLELMHNLKQNAWRNTAYWLALWLDQLPFTYSQASLPRCGATH